METETILIRHGHAVRINGNYVHAPLTELGRKQADLTGLRFCNEESRLDGFYASPLRRTQETSAIIGSKIPRSPTCDLACASWKGSKCLCWSCSSFSVRIGWFGHYLYDNVGKPLKWPIAGRVSTVVTDLVQKHEGGKVAVVTHSGVISAILAWYFPQKRRQDLGVCRRQLFAHPSKN